MTQAKYVVRVRVPGEVHYRRSRLASSQALARPAQESGAIGVAAETWQEMW